MKTKYILLKETVLNSNCPECYSKESLTLSFKQKISSSKFIVKTNGDIIEDMNCTKCETTIFPGRWTDDIERVYSYHKKTINPKPKSIRFTKIFYMLFFSVFLSIGIGVYLYVSGVFNL